MTKQRDSGSRGNTGRRMLATSASLALLAACEPAGGDATIALPLSARCTANVEGLGPIAIEDDYLPHVVACENGAAPFEALAAQAIAARSYLYYVLDREGSITDGTGDQVFTCAQEPNDEHFEAVRATERVVLRYDEQLVAGFYVAGATPSSADCVADASDSDPSHTERFVTYNRGRLGREVKQTSLGFIDPDNLSNRGCMSQNGSTCLAGGGASHDEVLAFYYGGDIAPTLLPSCDPSLEPAPISREVNGCRCSSPTPSSSSWSLLIAAGGLYARRRRR